MRRRYGLDTINYLTDTSVPPLDGPDSVSAADEWAQDRRRELQELIDRKQVELNELMARLRQLEA